MIAVIYEVVYSDGRVERVLIRATSQRQADELAERWSQQLGVEAVVPADEDEPA